MESRSRRRSWIGAAPFLLLGSLVAPVPAALAAPTAEPGIARVSLIEGQVSCLHRDTNEWSGVSINGPLVTGDRFYSGPASRAEIQLAPGVDLRVASDTELLLEDVSPGVTRVAMAFGRATVRLSRDPSGREVEVTTPAARFVLRERGVYRLEVDAEGRSTAMVREGELTVHATGGVFTIPGGSGVVIDAVSAGAPERLSLAASDDWDEWEEARARRVAAATSRQYVNEDIYGAEDLDEAGEWEYRPSYGHVWRPTVVATGWAPYTTGRWSWVRPWGWTWVDYAPWGWAPYHYGRWLWLDESWWWAPGPVVAAPVYSPALVAFYGAGFGTGASWAVSVGVGPWVGWAPLGWGEPCIPWWGGFAGVTVGVPWWGGWGGPRVINNVYVNQQVNVYNVDVKRIRFSNVNAPRGFTAVSRRSFAGGNLERVPVGRVEGHELTPVAGLVPVSPERASRYVANPAQLRAAAVPPARGSAFGRSAVDRGDTGTDDASPVVRRTLGSSRENELPAREAGAGPGRTPDQGFPTDDVPRRGLQASGGSLDGGGRAGVARRAETASFAARGDREEAVARRRPGPESRAPSRGEADADVGGGRLSVMPRATRPAERPPAAQPMPVRAPAGQREAAAPRQAAPSVERQPAPQAVRQPASFDRGSTVQRAEIARPAAPSQAPQRSYTAPAGRSMSAAPTSPPAGTGGMGSSRAWGGGGSRPSFSGAQGTAGAGRSTGGSVGGGGGTRVGVGR